jgi:hypothetical protein
MSDQSQFYNPQSDRMALSGSGFILPKLTTAQRLALSVGVNDTGLEVYDTTAGSLYLWTGTAWSAVGGGGGSKRILATTLTYTGTTSTATNQITATVTGTLPNPTTVLSGGTLQSVEYVAQSLVDYNISITFISTGAVNDARIPFTFGFTCGGAGSFQSFVQQTISVPSSGTNISTNVNNRVMNANCVYDAALISVWGFTPSVTMRVGEPNYAFMTGLGSVSENIIYNSLQLDGTIKVYYLFE